MSIEKIKNYLRSGFITRAFDEIVKVLEGDDFETAEAIIIFNEEFLNNYEVIKKLINEKPKWYESIPERVYKNEELIYIVEKIEVCKFASLLYYEKTENNKKEHKYKKLEIIQKELSEHSEKIKNYGLLLMKELIQEEIESDSIWVVEGNIAHEKKFNLIMTNDGKVDVLCSVTKKENIDSFADSARKALLMAKNDLKLKESTGIVLHLNDIGKDSVIDGYSATLAIYVAILKKISNIKISGTAFLADIDIITGKLKVVDKDGLKMKLEKAIQNGYKSAVVAEGNYMTAISYNEKIKVQFYEKTMEIIEQNNIRVEKRHIKENNIKGLILFGGVLIMIVFLIVFAIGNVLYRDNSVISNTSEKNIAEKKSKKEEMQEEHRTVSNSTIYIAGKSIEKTLELKEETNNLSKINEIKKAENIEKSEKVEKSKIRKNTFLKEDEKIKLQIEYNIICNEENEKMKKVRIVSFNRCFLYLVALSFEGQIKILIPEKGIVALEKEREYIFPEGDYWYEREEIRKLYLICSYVEIDKEMIEGKKFLDEIATATLVSEDKLNNTIVSTVKGDGAFISEMMVK